MTDIKILLDREVNFRNKKDELSFQKPDPLLIAKRFDDEYIILLCALFAYGKASLIVKFLNSLDFSLLDQDENKIKTELSSFYYRFQNSKDIIAIFIALKRLKQETSLNELFLQGYKKDNNVLEGIDYLISNIKHAYDHQSKGYSFLISNNLKRDKFGLIKHTGNSPYKRWNMYLRWMVRSDNLDLGLWHGVDKKDLILPLDTHTFKVSQKLGLLKRKTYDLQSAVEITNKLKEFDENDPIKYDFALYRLGQEKIV